MFCDNNITITYILLFNKNLKKTIDEIAEVITLKFDFLNKTI